MFREKQRLALRQRIALQIPSLLRGIPEKPSSPPRRRGPPPAPLSPASPSLPNPPPTAARLLKPRPPTATAQPSSHPAPCSAAATRSYKLLGEGGMGAVYKARDRRSIASSALKVIRPEMAAQSRDPRALQAGTPASVPGHPSQRHPHLRPRRSRRREVHHHGVHRGRKPAHRSSARTANWRRTKPSTSWDRRAPAWRPPTTRASSIAI